MSESRKPLMAGNWKMNLNHLEAIAHVQTMAFALTTQDYESCDVLVLAPFTDLRSVQVLVETDKVKIQYGAQDMSPHDSGAYTGDISGGMLTKLGCTYVVVGHSERREYHHETNQDVNAKALAALRHGLTPIIAFGESLEVRDSGDQVAFVLGQVEECLAGFSDEQARSSVLAYEPIWAIGTGRTASPEDAQEVCGAVRKWLHGRFPEDVAESMRILYGGSMKAANAASLMAQPDIDGGLVGGASLDPGEFVTMVRYRQHTG